MLAPNNSDQEASRFIVQLYLDRVVSPLRYSEILFSQLMHIPYFGGMNHPSQFVIHEIAVLEGHINNSQTKKPDQFTYNPLLKGFWKKHFCLPQHLGGNVARACGLNGQNSKRFPNIASPIIKKHANIEYVSHQEYCKNLSAELATQIMQEAEKRKDNKKNTGDYLVYYPHQGQNYYLCIGKHRQDEFIYKAIDLCSAQFPFLKDVICNRITYEVA